MAIIIQVKQTCCVRSHTGEKEGRIGIPFTDACDGSLKGRWLCPNTW